MELIKKDIFLYIVLSILFAITVQQFPFFKGNSLHLIHAIKNFELASLELITQSKNETFDMTVSSFRGLAKTCKGCHQKFRN